MCKAVVSVPGYLCVWEGALFCQMHLGLTGCFTLSGVFKMDTTPESYLDLFPLMILCFHSLFSPHRLSLLTLSLHHLLRCLFQSVPLC